MNQHALITFSAHLFFKCRKSWIHLEKQLILQKSAPGPFQIKSRRVCFLGLKMHTGDARSQPWAGTDSPCLGWCGRGLADTNPPDVEPTQCLGQSWPRWVRSSSATWASPLTWPWTLFCSGIWADRQAGAWSVLALLVLPFHTPASYHEGSTPRGPLVQKKKKRRESHQVDMNPIHSLEPHPACISRPSAYR